MYDDILAGVFECKYYIHYSPVLQYSYASYTKYSETEIHRITIQT